MSNRRILVIRMVLFFVVTLTIMAACIGETLIAISFAESFTKSSNAVPTEIVQGGIRYSVSDTDARVIGHEGNPVNLVIPENINGKPVVSIAADAFSSCQSLKTVQIPKTVTEIEDGDYTFSWDDLGYTPHGAFANCKSLISVTIPSDSALRYIGRCAFANCTSLQSVILPSSVREFALSCFESCSSLKNLVLPEGLETIGQNALSGTGLVTLHLPASLTDFHPCNYFWDLESITVAEGNRVYEAVDGVLFCSSCTWLYPAAKKDVIYNVPDGYYVHNDVFTAFCDQGGVRDWPYLRVVNIGKERLYNSPTQTIYRIDISDDNPYYTSIDGILYDKACTTVLQIPRYTSDHVIIAEGIESIAGFAGYWTNFTSITLPNSLKRIEESAFKENKRLQSIAIPSGVTNIGDYVFENCDSLKSIKIPQSVTEIGEMIVPYSTLIYCMKDSAADLYAQKNGYQVQYVNNPLELTDAVLYLPEDLKTIGEEAFVGLTCQAVVVPDGCTTIGKRAFANCRSLAYVRIPVSVKSIADDAFEGCGEVTIERY